jgi:hypothetical protein
LVFLQEVKTHANQVQQVKANSFNFELNFGKAPLELQRTIKSPKKEINQKEGKKRGGEASCGENNQWQSEF